LKAAGVQRAPLFEEITCFSIANVTLALCD
jgi:hypothetical protein